jgi:hypothetical protein
MTCDCSRLAYGALLMLPLECKTILGPFERDFVLTDVVFDLYTHPNGAASKGCGFVWNVSTQWSRLLVGGTVTDPGRRYSLESGILCPRRSNLSICSCYFVNEPTALFSARVTGCFCEHAARPPINPGPFLTVRWADGMPADALSPLDPTGDTMGPARSASLVTREALGTAYNDVEPGDLVIQGGDNVVTLRPGEARALHVTADRWQWSSERGKERVGRGPKGTSLLVARRSPDGRLVHWAMYRESPSVTDG